MEKLRFAKISLVTIAAAYGLTSLDSIDKDPQNAVVQGIYSGIAGSAALGVRVIERHKEAQNAKKLNLNQEQNLLENKGDSLGL